MPKYEHDHSDGNESAHSLDSEYGGLDVPIMRTPRAKKALTMANEKLYHSSREKNGQSADSATMTIWHTPMPL